MPQIYVINDLNGEEIVPTFYQKELQNKNKKEFRTEKVIKRKGNKLYVKCKGYNNLFDSWIDEKVYMSEYFGKPSSLGANVKDKLDLYNCATKKDFKKCSRS